MDEQNAGVKLQLFPAAAGSLFPISQVSNRAEIRSLSAQHLLQQRQQAAGPSWLSNTSFSQTLLPPRPPQNPAQIQVDERPASPHADEKRTKQGEDKQADVSDEEEDEESKRRKEKKRKKAKEKEDRHRKKHKKQEAKQLAEDSAIGNLKNSRSERKAAADIWISDSGWQKEYYFDSRGDRDNLAFESLYSNDVARYHPRNSKEIVDAGKLWAAEVCERMPQCEALTWTMMVTALEKAGRVDDARRAFDGMVRRDGAAWKVMILAYFSSGRVEEARCLFEICPLWDMAACSMMLAANEGDLEEAERIFGSMLERDVVVLNAMIMVYAKAGHMNKARAMFDEAPRKDVFLWTGLIAAYVRVGSLERAVEAFTLMPMLDTVACNALIRTVGMLNPESDSCSQDESLRSAGRYWSAKAAVLERRRDFKRMLLGAAQESEEPDMSASFVTLEAEQKPREECWEDYVLNKTKGFSQMTHDEPQNEDLWISFANFQDEIIQAEKRKTMVQHAIDKKILLLERALEFHPDSERLLLLYLETSKRRDDLSTLLSKWERIIMKHSGSYRLWWQYLRLRRSTFSKFSVSTVRKLYSQALQALAAARTRQQIENDKRRKGDDSPGLLEAEIGMVTVFLDLCRFEWQSGHHELAIGLLQAQFEFSCLCPLISLSQNNKLRLFEEFWISGAKRIGESGATGWSTWMQQQEEQIQKAKAMTSHKVEDESGWRGWKEPQIVDDEPKPVEPSDQVLDADDNDDSNNEEGVEEDDAALLEKLGLNLDLAKDAEVDDVRIWKRWADEESQRDIAQWLPVKTGCRRDQSRNS